MQAKSASVDYAAIVRVVESYRRTDRAFHLPLIGFLLGGVLGTLMWAGIAWVLCTLV